VIVVDGRMSPSGKISSTPHELRSLTRTAALAETSQGTGRPHDRILLDDRSERTKVRRKMADETIDSDEGMLHLTGLPEEIREPKPLFRRLRLRLRVEAIGETVMNGR
jgi:hypothetical protein